MSSKNEDTVRDFAILEAIQNNDLPTFKTLLGDSNEEIAQSANRPFSHCIHHPGLSLFLACAKYGRYELLEFLLQIPGININHQDGTGNSALSVLIINKEDMQNYGDTLKCAKLLVSHPLFEFNLANNNNTTALMLAAMDEHHYQMLQLVLKVYNVDVTLRNNDNESAVLIATEWLYATNVRLLLRHPDIDINEIFDDGNTMLKSYVNWRNIGEIGLLCGRQLLNRTDIDANNISNIIHSISIWDNTDTLLHKIYTHALFTHGYI